MSNDKTSEAPLILGVSGLRGIVGESLTPEVATRYAAAFGRWLNARMDHRAARVALVRDGRRGGEIIKHAAISGLLSAGCDVTDYDIATTPTAGTIVDLGECDAAMVVTASHNPQQWNGLKCLVDDEPPAPPEGFEDWDDDKFWAWQRKQIPPGARAPNATEADEIIALFHHFDWKNSPPARSPNTGSSPELEHASDVVGRLADLVEDGQAQLPERLFGPKNGPKPRDGFQIVLDSVNASGARAANALFARLNVHAVNIHGDDSGIFPHPPEPTKANLSQPGGLCDAVPGLRADVGFAQDPDADRLAIVDERGLYIGEEYTLVLCAMSILGGSALRADSSSDDSPGGSPQPVLVTNLSTSRMIEDVAAHFGARVERTPVGEANVVARMKQLMASGESVVLGGEGNGGVIWPEVTFVRDSLSGMALVLALMARTGKTVSQLVEEVNNLSAGGAGYAIIKRKVDIATKADAQPAVKSVARWGGAIDGAAIDTQDGVRVDFTAGQWAGSWVHVRASNTEPIMRLICEAPTIKIAKAVLAETERAIG